MFALSQNDFISLVKKGNIEIQAKDYEKNLKEIFECAENGAYISAFSYDTFQSCVCKVFKVEVVQENFSTFGEKQQLLKIDLRVAKRLTFFKKEIQCYSRKITL